MHVCNGNHERGDKAKDVCVEAKVAFGEVELSLEQDFLLQCAYSLYFRILDKRMGDTADVIVVLGELPEYPMDFLVFGNKLGLGGGGQRVKAWLFLG